MNTSHWNQCLPLQQRWGWGHLCTGTHTWVLVLSCQQQWPALIIISRHSTLWWRLIFSLFSLCAYVIIHCLTPPPPHRSTRLYWIHSRRRRCDASKTTSQCWCQLTPQRERQWWRSMPSLSRSRTHRGSSTPLLSKYVLNETSRLLTETTRMMIKLCIVYHLQASY